ncbi:glycosyltransferase family 2 protein [Pseudonocardia halophobica]|uniref:4,4'-diaponeurosporenoate glycosyltransferase n=1 Tax=Pseudonocardia halophobica TaxID=29401 RepID=A0A9W6LCW9_9PSEU|nr:glycosyltransferase [Pseudonocardia halophobica]GLL14529.1 glycosyl transferase [Pseudonocardia halophobica]
MNGPYAAFAPGGGPVEAVEAVAVVVPARDEAERLGSCLRSVRVALAGAGLPGAICVVADRCTDGTEMVAAPHAEVVRNTAARTIGELRTLGARRLLARLPARTWLLSTDADTVVPPSWVADHLRHTRRGADAVAGVVDLDDPEVLPADVLCRYTDLVRAGTGTDRHTHAYAANLGVRAEAFVRVGGFPAVPSGEEHALLARLRAAGYRVVSPTDVRARTSARTEGRAVGGLADLLRGLGA